MRHEIRQILLEDDGGGDFGGGGAYYGDAGDWGTFYGDYGGFGGGGLGGGFEGDLYKIFLEPFVDAGKVALASAKDVGSKTLAVAETLYQGIPTLVIPFVAASYGEIKEAERKRAAEIRQQYGDAFARVDAGFRDDALGFAFTAAPAHFITHALLKKAVGPLTKAAVRSTIDTINILTGRSEYIARKTEALSDYIDLLGSSRSADEKHAAFQANLAAALGYGASEASAVAGGAIAGAMAPRQLDEKDSPKKLPSVSAVMKKMMADPQVQQELEDSDMANAIRDDVQAMLSATLMALIQQGEKFKSAKTIDDLEKITGKQIKVPGAEGLEPQVREKLQADAVAIARKGALQQLRNSLQIEKKQLLQKGIDKGHPIIRSYDRAISRFN